MNFPRSSRRFYANPLFLNIQWQLQSEGLRRGLWGRRAGPTALPSLLPGGTRGRETFLGFRLCTEVWVGSIQVILSPCYPGPGLSTLGLWTLWDWTDRGCGLSCALQGIQ